MPFSDPTAGFSAIHRKVLKKLVNHNISSDGYGFLIETKYFTWKDGFSVKELPIVFTEMRDGQSKLNFSIKVHSAIRVVQLGLGRIWNLKAHLRFCFIKSSLFKLRGFTHEKKIFLPITKRLKLDKS